MCPNPQSLADLVKFTEEIFNGKLHFLFIVKLKAHRLLGHFNPFHSGVVFHVETSPLFDLQDICNDKFYMKCNTGLK